MSDIFLSHSSQDNAAAAELMARLAGAGHDSVFLDFDPAAGIPAGRDWERELYDRLRDCQAVIVLCSESSMASRWCFVEIAHAKALGKHVFPVKVDGCAIDPVLTSRQVLDLTADKEDAYARLWRGLKAAGLDPEKSFKWDRERPPFPGLLAFQEDDAAVFFGREPEIRQGLDALQRLRRFGGARALLVFGASGSGKSSLVRAGLLPRLRRSDEWIVARPFRPLGRPLRELAAALAAAFVEHGKERDWREIESRLEADGDALGDLARDLRLAARQPDAVVLLTVDQAEELVGGEASRVEPFLGRLRAAVEAPGSPLMVIFTVRADLLGTFHKYPAVRGFEMADLRVGPVPRERLPEIVEGPARLARLQLEDGLARAMVDDTETDDALPLLAFALRELYDRRVDGRLTLETYREKLGGLEGSVARAAEAVWAARPLSGEQQQALRRSFVSLARIDEGGDYARRALPWSAVPEDVREAMERFAGARLLVRRGEGGERVAEVAHEALFRSWDRLRTWLDENRELLLWRKRVEPARLEWERGGRDPEALLRGPALGEGRLWLERHGDRLPGDEREFVAASVRAEARRRRRKVLSAAAAFVVLALAATAMSFLYARSERLRALAEDQRRVAIADDLIARDPTRAALVLLDVRDPETTTRALAAMSETLQQSLAYVELEGHDGRLSYAAFSPDGRRVLTASNDGTARLWSVDGTLLSPIDERAEATTAAAFSPDGRLVLTAYEDGLARLVKVDGGAVAATLGEAGGRAVTAAAFSSDGGRVVVAYDDGVARVWSAAGELEAVLEGHRKPLTAVDFSPDGGRVVTASEDATARVWDVGGALEAELVGHTEPLTAAVFSPDGVLVATASRDATVRLRTVDGKLSALLEGHQDAVVAAAFSPDGTRVATASEDGTARVWSAQDGRVLAVLEGHEDSLTAIAFSARGRRLVTASEDQTARVWNDDGEGEVAVLRGHANAVSHAAFSPDGRRVVTASWDGTARVWLTDDPMLAVVVDDDANEITAAAFSAGGRRLVTAHQDLTVRLWKADPDTGAYGWPVVLGEHGDSVTSAAMSPDGRLAVTGSQDATARIWDADRPPVVLGAHAAAVSAVAFSPDGAHVVTGSEDATARVRSVDGGDVAVLSGHTGGVTAVEFSADGRRVITGSEDATARVWELDGRHLETLEGHFEMVTGVALLATAAVTCSADRTTKVWPGVPDFGGAAPRAPLSFPEHSVNCRSIAWSADGAQVATVRGRGTIWVRRLRSPAGRPLVLEADAAIVAAAFTAEGDRLLTVAEDGVVRRWHLSAERLRQEIESATRVCLEPEVRERILDESSEEARRMHAACVEARPH